LRAEAAPKSVKRRCIDRKIDRLRLGVVSSRNPIALLCLIA